MEFVIGDKVSLIDSTEEFIVIKVDDNKIKVVDDFGFENIFSKNELVIINQAQFKNIPIEVKPEIVHKTSTTKSKKKKQEVPVIDLHMENLVSSHKAMTNHEIVTFQIDHLNKELTTFIEKGYKELIVVHGIGKGKLKKEVRYFLQGLPYEIEYMDDHVGYGVGATRVFIHKKRGTY